MAESQQPMAASIVSNVVCCQTNGCNAPATQSPVTTPAPIVTQYDVQLELSLPITLAQFNGAEQELFREQMAVAAGLQRSDAGRVAISFAPSSRRRLFAGLLVNVTINMPNASSAQSAAAGLTITNINQALSAVGLPTVSLIAMYIVPLGSARFTFSRVKDTTFALLKAQICQSRHVSL